MKKNNSSKNIIIALIVVIILIFTISFSALKRSQAKNNPFPIAFLNDTVGVLDRVVSAPINWVKSAVYSVQDLFDTYEENSKLKSRLDDYAQIESRNQDLEKEIQKLKEQLKLDATLSNYDTTTANVINRSPDTWQDILVIDKGSQSGVKVNMPVMSGSNLVGRVIEVSNLSAKVELLTSSNQSMNYFPVKITPQEGDVSYGLLGSYDTNEEAFVVSELTTIKNLKEGDYVSTSGLGGNSPAGLVVGKVKKIKEDSFGLNNEVYVTPLSSLYEISVVTVVIKAIKGGQ